MSSFEIFSADPEFGEFFCFYPRGDTQQNSWFQLTNQKGYKLKQRKVDGKYYIQDDRNDIVTLDEVHFYYNSSKLKGSNRVVFQRNNSCDRVDLPNLSLRRWYWVYGSGRRGLYIRNDLHEMIMINSLHKNYDFLCIDYNGNIPNFSPNSPGKNDHGLNQAITGSLLSKQFEVHVEENNSWYSRLVIQPIEYITKNKFEYWRGNIVKYASRAGHKIYDGMTKEESEKRDLDKIIYYAEKRKEELGD